MTVTKGGQVIHIITCTIGGGGGGGGGPNSQSIIASIMKIESEMTPIKSIFSDVLLVHALFKIKNLAAK